MWLGKSLYKYVDNDFDSHLENATNFSFNPIKLSVLSDGVKVARVLRRDLM